MKKHTQKQVHRMVISVGGFVMTLVLILVVTGSAPVSQLQSSVISAQVAEADEEVYDEEEEMSVEEELVFLENAEKQLKIFQRSLKGFKTSVTRLEKKFSKKSLISVYEKMQDALQPVCAYRDAFISSVEARCEVLGNHIKPYDTIDVKVVLTPLLRNFIRTFDPQFFTNAQQEIEDYRTELHELLAEEEGEYEEEED